MKVSSKSQVSDLKYPDSNIQIPLVAYYNPVDSTTLYNRAVTLRAIREPSNPTLSYDFSPTYVPCIIFQINVFMKSKTPNSNPTKSI